MRRLLVLSVATLNGPHRKPYDVLARKPGWEVHLVGPERVPIDDRSYAECAPVDPEARYVFHKLPVESTYNGRVTWFRGLLGLVRRVRPDAIFAEYDPGSVPILHAYLASRGLGTKVVGFTVENIAVDHWADARASARRGQLRATARAAFVGALGAAGRRVTAGLGCLNMDGMHIYGDLLGYRAPMALVPLGVDLDLFKPLPSAEMRASLGLGDAFVVGYFGRMVPEKCVHLVVEALAELPGRVRLLLDNFAPSPYVATIRKRIDELGLRDRVVNVEIHHSHVPRYMSCCDVVVLPSIESGRFKEQYGRVLPEAMACGVPVIATRSGNLPVMVGDAGIVIEQGSAAAIRDAIRRLMDDPALRADLSARGRRRVEERWSVDVQVRALEALVVQAIEGRPMAGPLQGEAS